MLTSLSFSLSLFCTFFYCFPILSNMGNCLISDKPRAWNEEKDVAEEACREVEQTKRMRECTRFDGGKKKIVRFRFTGDEGNCVEKQIHVGAAAAATAADDANKVEFVRIKVVVTREELEQILNSDKNDLKQSSVEKLVTAMRLRGRRIYEVRRNDSDGSNSRWRPALDSIPEDHR